MPGQHGDPERHVGPAAGLGHRAGGTCPLCWQQELWGCGPGEAILGRSSVQKKSPKACGCPHCWCFRGHGPRLVTGPTANDTK